MKKCPKCGEENLSTAQICQKCAAPLGDVPESKADSEYFFEKINKREKFGKVIKLLLVPLYYIVYFIFYIKCVLIEGSTAGPLLIAVFFPIVYLLLMFKADSLFRFNHMFDIDNVEKVELSDWYYLSSKISACIVLALGLFLVIYVYFSLAYDSAITINVG